MPNPELELVQKIDDQCNKHIESETTKVVRKRVLLKS